MVWILTLIMAFTFLGCGSSQKRKTTPVVYTENTDFQYYIDLFKQESSNYNPVAVDSLVVQFGDLEKPTVGNCTVYRDMSSPVITIDRQFWEEADDVLRENLMFHELGHCILFRGHKTTQSFGVPDSIMYPTLIPQYYEYDRDYYIKELFSITRDWATLTSSDHFWSCDGHH